MILEAEMFDADRNPVETGTDVYITIKKVTDLAGQEFTVARTNVGVVHIDMPIRANVWAYDWDIEWPTEDSYHIQFDYNGIADTVITGMIDPTTEGSGDYAITGTAGIIIGRIDKDGENARVKIGNKEIYLRRK